MPLVPRPPGELRRWVPQVGARQRRCLYQRLPDSGVGGMSRVFAMLDGVERKTITVSAITVTQGRRTIRSRGSQEAALGAGKKQSSLHGEVRSPLETDRASEVQVGAERVAHRFDKALAAARREAVLPP